MTPSVLEAVLYDWDGTLVDSAEASFRCYEELFASYGIRFDRDGDRGRVERELAAHGIAEHFGAVVCGSDPVEKKPHPQALLAALERLGIPPRRAAYVGDSPEDVEMARRAGVWSVGIPGGFPNRPALERARPDLMAERLADAVEALIRAARTGTSR